MGSIQFKKLALFAAMWSLGQVEKAMIQTQGTLYEILRSNKYTEYKVNMDSLNGEKRIE